MARFSHFSATVSTSPNSLELQFPDSVQGKIVIKVNGRNVGESYPGQRFRTVSTVFDGSESVTLEYSREAQLSDLKNLSEKKEFSEAIEAGIPVVYTEINTIANGSRANLNSNSAEALTLPTRSYVRYLTYIPTQYVGAPTFVCTLKSSINLAGYAIFGKTFDDLPQEFNGNNRLWDPEAIDNSKTAFTVGVNWPLGGKLSTDKRVGPTKLYAVVSGKHVLVGQDQASTDGMSLIKNVASSSYVDFEMKENVVNRMCLPLVTLGISFDYNVTLWRDGSYLMRGVSIAVPNHELYYSDSENPTWVPVMRRTLNSFDCLAAYNSGKPNCQDTGIYSRSK